MQNMKVAWNAVVGAAFAVAIARSANNQEVVTSIHRYTYRHSEPLRARFQIQSCRCLLTESVGRSISCHRCRCGGLWFSLSYGDVGACSERHKARSLRLVRQRLGGGMAAAVNAIDRLPKAARSWSENGDLLSEARVSERCAWHTRPDGRWNQGPDGFSCRAVDFVRFVAHAACSS